MTKTLGSWLLLLLWSVTGCTPATPEQVTQQFWQAALVGEADAARVWLSADSSAHFDHKPPFKMPNAKVSTGKITLDQERAEVITVLDPGHAQRSPSRFVTFLTREQGQWRVDYVKTQAQMSRTVLIDLFQSLENLGNTVQEYIDQSIPMLEKQLHEWGRDFSDQLNQLRERLPAPSTPPAPQRTRPGVV
ncbi:MAG: hypothetical protein RQ715_09605 [Methylococcales bacterium]|nr:hypothetical protein [Methylococcales bacterium]